VAELTSELNSAFTSALCLIQEKICICTENLFSTQNVTFKDSNGTLLSFKDLKILRISKNAFEGNYESRLWNQGAYCLLEMRHLALRKKAKYLTPFFH